MLGVGRLHAAPAEQGPSTRGGQKEKDGNGGGERGETQTGFGCERLCRAGQLADFERIDHAAAASCRC